MQIKRTALQLPFFLSDGFHDQVLDDRAGEQGGGGVRAAARRLGLHVGAGHRQGLRQRQGAGRGLVVRMAFEGALRDAPYFKG